MRSYAIAILAGLWLAACGGASTEAASTAPAAAVDAKPPVPEETELHRAALDGLLARGPAYVLAMVQIDPAKSGGRFVGFTIVSFRTQLPAYLDLRPGDVVTRVNGLPIERPEQFFAVFEALKTAGEVKFDVLRDGERREIAVPIVP
jgi:type II secretory pathway component PulC